MRTNRRVHIVTLVYMAIFLVVFLVIAGRFLYIQVTGKVQGVSLEELAEKKRTVSNVVLAERGKIYDTNGMLLAFDRPTFKMYAVLDENFTLYENEPKHVQDIEDAAEKLASILDVDATQLIDILRNGKENDLFQVEFGNVGKNLSQKTKEEIEALEIPGINFEQESIRYYPNGIFASHIIGFAQKSNHSDEEADIIGFTGIEKQKDELLQGKDGHISYERDGYLEKLLYPKETITEPKNGADIYLTLDQKVQTLLEDMLSQAEEDFAPERMTAVVLNAKSGEVVAMSSRPSFDLNNPVDVKNWYNDVVSTPFEPGSTVKPFTWAAAIDAGVYNGEEKFQSGKYQINPIVEPIHDHNNGKGWGKISFDEGFVRSSNVAASKLVWEKVGPDEFLEYLKAFHFDQKTNIDLPDEISGQILYNWPIEKLTTAFGQGSTLTPIQQVKAATALTNGGEMLEPFVIKNIVDPDTDEVIESKSREVVGQPISEEAASKVLQLMEDVVHSEDGTGKLYQLEDYTVAGKTGTAQIPNPDGPGYLSGRENNIYSFLGISPADDPELIMYVSVSKPKLEEGESGYLPVAHIFTNVMENGLRYLNIEPDKEQEKTYEIIEFPEIENKQTEKVAKQLKEKGLQVTVVGEGDKVKKSNVSPGEEIFSNDHIFLITDEPTMPNIKGWSLREVLQFGYLLELRTETIGEGYVIKQSIEEGTPLNIDDYLGVELKEPAIPKEIPDDEAIEDTNE
ncbi:MAG TPA: penicillin-binding protein [Bacillota bacterium]|nr:penicillin-binding protein [Bacillota bacterium]